MKRGYPLLLLLLCPALAHAGVSVTVGTPANYATIGTQVRVKATASSTRTITGWYIYANNKAVWNTPQWVSSIDATFSLQPGNHQLLVRAWDSSGAYGNYYLNLKVSDSGKPVVSVSSPASGSKVGASVQLKASGSSSRPISGWYVYVDQKAVWNTGAVSSITANLTLATGIRQVKVRAWDSSGAYGDADLTLSVQNSSLLPTPPSNATVLYKIDERTTGWGDCTVCAADPRDSDPALADYYRAQFQSSPSLDGASVKFWVGGKDPWAQALHWVKLGSYSSATNFLWEFSVYTRDDALKANVLEFDLFQAVSGRKYMFGTQCNYIRGVWQGWNEQLIKWVDIPGVPCVKFEPYKWHKVIWYFKRTWDNKLHYVSLTVNGKTYSVNMYQPSAATSWGNVLGVQFQQGMNSKPDPYSIWVDGVKLSIW